MTSGVGSPSPPRVLVVGDVMTDVIVRPDGALARGSDRRARIAVEPGGSGANQAAWLGHFGVAVDFVARVGADDAEAEASRLAALGVTPHLAADAVLPSGRLIALIDPDGERSFFTDRGANDALRPADIPDALIAGAAHVHLSGYAFVAPSARAAAIDVMRRAAGKPVSVDPGSAEFLREVGPANFLEWTKGAAMLLPNADEAEVLTGASHWEAQCVLLAESYPLVVLKLGRRGCLAAEGRRQWRALAPRVEAVDATGAGDAFVAAFLAARLAGVDTGPALRRAVAAGSWATTRVGARPVAGDSRSFGE